MSLVKIKSRIVRAAHYLLRWLLFVADICVAGLVSQIMIDASLSWVIRR